ncbi:unnamed protein product [Durusdinium trenchii]|uniref:Uncharacterized protein n=2 Tax=Durusdinium trenchii TaxID=1381693 RepID=A0ABP0R0D4_9DINO
MPDDLSNVRNLQDLVALEVRLVLAWLFGLSAAAPLTVGEETPQESKPKFKPNFVKFVISTSSSKPYEHFLGNARGKAMVEKWKAAIRLYSENSVYAQMNQALRHDDMTGLKEYGSLINLTMQPFGLSAMKTHSVLKPFVGTVWRGCNLSSSDLQKYEVGEVVLWEAFSSTSTSPSSAFKGNVVFEIHCNKALEVQKGDEHELKDLFNDLIVPAQIHHLSKYPNENEVLYPPYTKFRLVSRTDMLLTTNIVLETMEFPSLSLLAEEGKWEEVKKGLHARQEHSDESSPAWFTQHASTLLPTITNKIVSEGSNSGGLNIITQLQAYGSDVTAAHDHLMEAGLDHSVKLPANHAKWYFDAVELNADDKQLSSRICLYNGRHWQEYFARQATVMEKWYKGGQQGKCQFTVVNNIGKKVPYVVFASEGKIYQKAVGGGMIGNSREVWRAPS